MYRHFLDPGGIRPLRHHATVSSHAQMLTNMRNLKLHEKIKMVRLSYPSWYPCSGLSWQQWTGARGRQRQDNLFSYSACQQLAACTYIRPTWFISPRERIVKGYLRKYKNSSKGTEQVNQRDLLLQSTSVQHIDTSRKQGKKI